MKRIILFTLCVSLAMTLCACTPAPEDVKATPAITQTTLISPDPTKMPTATPVVTPTTLIEATPTPAPSGPEMYSSYARLVSFDTDTGIAQFDYFEMLVGDEAVQYLVEHKGYSLEDAQEEVDNYADSEYIEKNDNPQLRAINLTNLSLSLMFQPSGEEVTDATPVPSTYSDFLTIWELDSNLLLGTYFYYIHVNDTGKVYLVEQVFWP